MYIEARLVFQHYIPDNYDSLLFLTVNNIGEPFVYELKDLKHPEEHIEINGYPVKPFIIQEGNPNIPDSDIILAEPNEIGWMDDGAHADSLRDIEINDFNIILRDYNGYCLIDVNEEDGNEYVLLYEGQATIALHDTYNDDNDDEEEDIIYDENDENNEND